LDQTQASLAAAAEPAGASAQKGIRHLSRPEKRSLFAMLLAIFFWFCGFNAVETFFTLFATKKLGASTGDATLSLTLFSLTLVAFALPAGILAGRFGRKKMIVIGLCGLILTFLPMIFLESLLVMRILLFVGGIFWACININSLPMVVELASSERIGSFTGYYYFFSFSAAIVSPTLFGWIRDLTKDYSTLFTYSVAAFALALICIALVRHGEASAPVPADLVEANDQP
jgi:maltose/moltooligosaccharide transporter